jgi:hypothetical protein
MIAKIAEVKLQKTIYVNNGTKFAVRVRYDKCPKGSSHFRLDIENLLNILFMF